MSKTEIIQVRCSERDKEEVKRQAEEQQMSISEYILYLIHKNESK